MKIVRFGFLVFASVAALCAAYGARGPVSVLFDEAVPQVRFAAEKLHLALESSGYDLIASVEGTRIVLERVAESTSVAENGAGAEEGFSIRLEGGSIVVTATDAAGLMYGGLEVAELIRIGGLQAIKEDDQAPYMSMRGTKFNIPLDVRSPSYTDPCDAAQLNMGEVWSLEFWKEYIDFLASSRYNYISLWNLHPFPSLVKVPEYPDIALDDVRRSTVQWKEHYIESGEGFDAPEIVENYETLKKITIEEKIEFWREVMRYGKGRNVDFYFVTWNIFDNGIDGKYGITTHHDNPTTRDYFRKSVKQMFLTYPDLRGVGLTTGENMMNVSLEDKENWAFDTYAKGILDAAAEMPGRKMTLIHRQHMADSDKIKRRFQEVVDHPDVEFLFSYKYAKAHVHSSVKQNFSDSFVENIGDMKTLWTLRNDDTFYFRWGAPDFVREFIENIPYEPSRGFYLGSDQYVWGREFMSRDHEVLNPGQPRELDVRKHWYQWTMWGRLGYDPTIGNDRFVALLADRFPGVDAATLFEAWQNASWIYPKTTGFHWGALDFQWYIEGSKSVSRSAETPSGFHDVNRFISLKPHPSTDYQSIPNFVKAKAEGKKQEGQSPLEIGNQILGHSERALSLLEQLEHGGDRDLRQTMDDIEAVAHLGGHFGNKILGATHLAWFRETGNLNDKEASIQYLNQAAQHWRIYAAIGLSNYKNPLWTNRVGYVDWKKLTAEVYYDVTIAGGEIDVPDNPVTPGGTILEAEDGEYNRNFTLESKLDGFQGTGYLDANGSYTHPGMVEWNFEAPESGQYLLEIRYALYRQGYYSMHLAIDDGDWSELTVPRNGSRNSWTWIREPVSFEKGANRIRIKVKSNTILDHINVLSLVRK